MTLTVIHKTDFKYRNDIEGLRSIAIIPVILYHAHLACPAGFIGVDVFFVISGYLITKIIQEESNRDRFTLISFYHRRIRRIFPALFVMITISSALAYIVLLPTELIAYGKSLLAAATFVANIFFHGQVDYFDSANEIKPLLHIWSLSVEEQFYIFWPIIFVTINTHVSEQKKTFLVAIGLVASLYYSEFLVHHKPKAAFYLTPSRSWELLLGALLATPAVAPWLGRMPRRAADVASIVGLAAICAAVFGYDSITPFPGLTALAPCLGAALVIGAGAQGPTAGGRLLSLPPFAFIGRISYSLYLWHWPILVFARLYLDRSPDRDETWCLISLILVLACLSWRFIEKPCRNRRATASGGRPWVAGGVAAPLAVAGVGALMVFSDGFPGRIQFPSRIQTMTHEIAQVRSEAKAFQSSPCLARRAALPPIERCLLGQASPNTTYDVVLWGDSHAAHLAPALATLGQRMGFTAREITKAGCGPLPGLQFFPEHEIRRECREFNKAAMESILRHRPGTVILAGWWDAFATGGLLMTPDSARPSLAQSLRTFVATVRSTVRTLTQAGNRVIVVSQAPTPTGDPVSCIERTVLIRSDASKCAARSALFAEAQSRVNTLLRSALDGEPDTQLANPFQPLCDEHECRIFTEQGNLVYMDGAHLSPAGARLAGFSLEASLATVGRVVETATR
jgi:peptidoglycan/LPS O-acetylase OafA/YrhL